MEAGFRLLSADHAVSLGDIAQYAGVGRATLHRHFSSRDDLIQALAIRALKEMDECAETAVGSARTCAEGLRLILDALIPLGDRHGFLAHFSLEDSPDIAREYQRQSDETREMIDAAKHEGLFNAQLSTAWIERMIDAVIITAWESIRAEELTPRQACDLAWNTLVTGLGARNER